MFVKWKMTANPFTISVDATVPQAIELMQNHGVRKLPVMDGHKLVGVVSQSDIDRASPSMATSFSAGEVAYLFSKLKVSKVMTRHPHTIGSEALLEEAAVIMRDNKIEMLPVVDDSVLVGVITESDILDAFIELNGARSSGARLVVEAHDAPGVMASLSALFSQHSVNINHIAVYRSGMDTSLVIIGINSTNTTALESALTSAGFTIRYTLKHL